MINYINLRDINFSVDPKDSVCGNEFTYSIVTKNLGNTSASNVVLINTLPTGVVFVPDSIFINGTSMVGLTLQDTLNIGSISAGETATLSYKVHFPCTTVPGSSPSFLEEVEQEIFRLVNIERGKVGKSPLIYDKTIESYSRRKSKDMGDKNYFSHMDLDGKYMYNYMIQDGISILAWAENIVKIPSSVSTMTLAQVMMNTWMNSAGHKANILDEANYGCTIIGIGVYKSTEYYYGTQQFVKLG